MIEKIKELMIKYRELIVYVIVGGMTTVFSWFVGVMGYMFLFDVEDVLQNQYNNILSWVAGVLFAYPTNRIWVFGSKNKNILKEFIEFSGSRVSTLFLDMFIMWLFVNVLHVNWYVSKILISSVLVMVTNYVISKFFVFKNKDAKKDGENEGVSEVPAE